MTHTKPTISVYGIGALGSSLVSALSKQGYSIISLYNRSTNKAENLAKKLKISSFGKEPSLKDEIGDLLFLTVSDDAIKRTVSFLAGQAINWPEKMVVHCSGVLTSSELEPLKNRGANVAAFHPLQTFSSINPDAFRGIYFTTEGDDNVNRVLKKMADELSAVAVTVQPEDKALLHAAAVVASNYLATLLQESVDIASLGSINSNTALNMLKPLVMETSANIFEKGAVNALSGPVARGDYETIQQHLELLAYKDKDSSLYRKLGLATCDLTDSNKTAKQKEIEKIRVLLS